MKGIAAGATMDQRSLTRMALAMSGIALVACGSDDNSKAGENIANPAQSRELSVSEQAAAARRYDPSSLIEVTKISNLPEALRSHFKGWMESGDTSGNAPYRFIVAGASNTSALVAFEELGYVPSTHAISYVLVNDNWVAARKWDAVGYPTSLIELKNTISQLDVRTSGR